MLRWAAVFLIIALVAGAFGLTGVAGAAAGIAKALFIGFLVLFCVTLVIGLAAGRTVTRSLGRTERDKHLLHR